MPRQVRNAGPSASSAGTRTVAQTRAAAARGRGGRASGSGSGPRPTTRASTRATSKKAPPSAGLQLALQQALPLPLTPTSVPAPAVRQLRSRQVPLPAPNASDPADGVNLILVQGIRRRSRSVTSSRASESSCSAVRAGTARGSSASAEARNPLMLRSSTPRSTKVSTRLTRQANQRSAPQTPCLPRTRTNKTALRRLEKNPSDEIIVCPICQEKLSANVIAAHASACNLYLCPVAWDNNCQWRGSVSQSVDHIAKGHRSVNRVTGPNAVIVLKSWRKASPLYWSSLQTCLGYNFLVEIKKIERFDKYPNFYGVVRLFGQQEDADRFEYKMTMKTRGKMARTSSYSTTVRALHENSVIHKDDAFVFDSSQAEIFSYEGNLEVEVSISVMKM